MARNNYNFGFDDKTDVNEAAKSNIAQVVKQNEQSSKTYERKSLEENFSYLKRVEELLGQVEVLRNKVHEGLKNIQQQSASMYANISTYIGTVQNNLANITVSVSEETRAQIKKAIQEEYAEERKKYIEEMDKFKEEFIADLKRGLREEAHEIIRSIRKSYEGMFWKTLLIVVACVMVAFGAFVKIFDGADKWLGILGMLLLMAALIIWAYKYSKLFGKE